MISGKTRIIQLDFLLSKDFVNCIFL